MNPYINLNRIEFVITNNCTSKCKHCSLGDFLNEKNTAIEEDKATEVVTELARQFDIGSVMTFGGEPLLYADTVCAVHNVACNCVIPSRQVITNGFFTKNEEKIISVAEKLKNSGVNSLLLSIDAFHSEYIPIDIVYRFAEAACKQGFERFMLHPAWVVNREHKNPYNTKTEECLAYFAELQIPISRGNNIFPSGNAAIHLSEYYEKVPVNLDMRCGEAKYTGKLDEVSCISINSNGDVIICSFSIGNIYKDSINEIIERYNPYKNPYTAALLEGGVSRLIEEAKKNGIEVDITKHYSPCGICHEVLKKL